MSLCQYNAIEQRARGGEIEAVAEVMRIAVGVCACNRACFVRRRAQETLSEQGIEVVAAGRAVVA